MGHEQTNVALQRSDVKRAEFIAEMMQFNTDMFIFVMRRAQIGVHQEIQVWLERYSSCKLQSACLW